MKNSEEYWRKKLSPEQYHVLRERGTEAPGTGKFLHNKKTGIYACGACGNALFDSKTKFDSETGWPSFYDALSKSGKSSVKLKKDFSMILPRTEVLCAKCGSHLGHIFSDGPKEKTGKRYCMNSIALDFKEKKK
ncbi:MAG: peptide-methionine (R)-S-oxide reductase MsrB [Candidatus Pacearchaeota archaeon]